MFLAPHVAQICIEAQPSGDVCIAGGGDRICNLTSWPHTFISGRTG